MKYLIASLLLLISSTSFAQETITIINNSNKASPSTVFARAYFTAAAKDHKVVFYQAQTCEQAVRKYNNTPNSVMIFNANVGIAARNKQLKCDPPTNLKAQNLIYSGASYFRICRKAGSTVQFDGPRVTYGSASVILSKGVIKDYNSHGLNLVGVPYGGSRNVMNAVVAGNVDYGIIGNSVSQIGIDKGTLDCTYSTDPRQPNFVGNKYPLKIGGMKIWKLIYTNIDDPITVNSLRYAAGTDPQFNAFMTKSQMTGTITSNFTDKNAQDFLDWIKYNDELYWKPYR